MISGLYVITDNNSDGALLTKVNAALIGGAKTVQYRAKDIRPDDRRNMAIHLKDLCDKYGAKLIINDFPELAQQVDAAGVHLGQEDISVNQARQLLGHNKLIGISTHNVDEALKAEMHGADYIGIGAIFPTASKDDTSVVGIKTLEMVRKAVRIPIVAIGGMTPDCAYEAINAGADAVAVISCVMGDSDPARAAKEFSLLFNRNQSAPNGKVLTVAGSDSGGGAGVQADIKTITLLGSYASSVLTALTAQNTLGVSETYKFNTDFVEKQLTTVLDDIGTDTVKTGMLSWSGIVSCVAKVIEERSLLAIVDPVMVAKGGSPLLNDSAHETMIARLLPQSYLLTPNIPEVKVMTGIEPQSIAEMIEAGRNLQELGARNVLIKGGHLSGDAIDILLLGDVEHQLVAPRFDTVNTHGTGCTLSAAIATFLAQGFPLKLAVERAKRFVSLAIEHAVPLGSGHGPVNHFQAAMQLLHETPTID